jgi:hypothetical protein
VVCATKRGRHIDNCTSFTRKITDFSHGFNEGETDCTANTDWIDRGRGEAWCELNTCKKTLEDAESFLNLEKS